MINGMAPKPATNSTACPTSANVRQPATMRAVTRMGSAAVVVAAVLSLVSCNQSRRVANGCYRFTDATRVGSLIAVSERRHSCGFTAPMLDGRSYTLARQVGQVVVVNFWAQWCGPCTVETPQLDLVYRTNKSRHIAFVGIDTKDVREKVRSFVESNHISYPIVFDDRARVAVAMGRLPVAGLPFTALIDRRQRVAAVYVGAVTAKDLQPVLGRLAAEPR
jgi:peroxiredoxin